MARDPLFEFDAPQTFVDLRAPVSPFPPGEHDPWFDRVHVEHSKPSAERGQQQQLEERAHTKPQSTKNWSDDKENRQVGYKQLKQPAKKKFTSLKDARAAQKPFQAAQVETEGKSHVKARKPLAERRDVGNRPETGRKRENKEMANLEALLAKHNKKFKAVHTYEPPQHSIREVKQWEREVKKSYYALSAEERVEANKEISVWKKQRQVGATR